MKKMVNHANRKPARYRIKATWHTKAGKPFVRYWRNNGGCIGWIFPEVKETANTYTRGAAGRFLNSRARSRTATYELEPV